MESYKIACLTLVIFYVLFTTSHSNDLKDAESAEDEWESKYGQIIFSAVVLRHGDRGPFEDFPTNEHSKKIARNSQLIKEGKKRAYRVGVWTRKRYDRLINGKAFDTDLLHMISSSSERCVVSGQLFLAGFYPPTSEEDNAIWNNNLGLHWQPIPIFTIPKEDRMFTRREYCARYVAEMEVDVKNSPELLDFYRNHVKTIDTIRMHGEYVIPEDADMIIRSIQRTSVFYDILYTQHQLGFDPPTWAKDIYPRYRNDFTVMYYKLHTWNHEMKRLKGGPFLQHIIQELENKRKNPESEKLFQFYSGHDGNIVTLLDMLKVWDYTLPDYSALLFFELRKLAEDFIVTVSIKFSEEAPLELLNIPKCPNPCTLDKFISETKSFIPDDWEAECKTLTPNYNTILF